MEPSGTCAIARTAIPPATNSWPEVARFPHDGFRWAGVSGFAMRFPRISRLRWDKPPGEADRLELLETMIARIEQGRMS